MSLDDIDVDEAKHMTIKRSTFYILISVIILLVFGMSSGALLGYSIVTSPRAMCSFVVNNNIGDQDAQDGCAYKLAKEHNDVYYCNLIQNQDLQKECVKIVTGD